MLKNEPSMSDDDVFQRRLTDRLSEVVVEPVSQLVVLLTKQLRGALISGLAGLSDPRLGEMLGKLYGIGADEIRNPHLNLPSPSSRPQSAQTGSASDSSPQTSE